MVAFFSECGGDEAIEPFVKCGGGVFLVNVMVVMRPFEPFVKCLQVPHEALEIVGMLINFCSGKFGYSICPIFSKGHAEFFREFRHDFC